MYTFFFTEESPFSQWFRCSFTDDGGKNTFTCAEQFMMYSKAMLFEDVETANKILTAVHPRQYKALGRKVKLFDDKVWNASREQIVLAGNHAKFTQNLKKLLLATTGTECLSRPARTTESGVSVSPRPIHVR